MNTNETKQISRVVAIARAFGAWERCVKSGNVEWQRKHEDALDALNEGMPSGSGFDSGTKLDETASTPNRLVFVTSFHHMDDNGMYCGWSEHCVIVTPDFETGFDLKVTGRNVRDIKEYIAEMFQYALSEQVAEWRGYPPVEQQQTANVA